jgi:hypothetical protein
MAQVSQIIFYREGAKVHEDDFPWGQVGRQPPADYGKILLCSFSKRASVTKPNDFSAA